MSNALLSVRTDDETKKEITDFAASVGLSVSAFVTVVLKQAVREGRIVLSPTLEPTPYLKKVMRKADADLKTNRNISPPMDRDEARKHLSSLMK